MSHSRSRTAEVVIVGGGLAGLSAAIYLGRAKRNTLVVDAGKSMARWEPEVQNYLGFPRGIAGNQLLRNARLQARRYGVGFARDRIVEVSARHGRFHLKGEESFYGSRRLLLATGIFHIPPDIPGVKPCLGHSMFFCKDCDGFRVQGKAVGIYGWTNETVEYALGLLLYSQCVALVTDGRKPRWDRCHQGWLGEYHIPVYEQTISGVRRNGRELQGLNFSDGTEILLHALFTTRGDLYYHELARDLGARVDSQGEIVVDMDMRSTVPGLYAAGCVTPANCQMIIAAGQGATAGQAINRDLFEESLASHSLRRFRSRQLRASRRSSRPCTRRTFPEHRVSRQT